jgi:hypothetical protein
MLNNCTFIDQVLKTIHRQLVTSVTTITSFVCSWRNTSDGVHPNYRAFAFNGNYLSGNGVNRILAWISAKLMLTMTLNDVVHDQPSPDGWQRWNIGFFVH